MPLLDRRFAARAAQLRPSPWRRDLFTEWVASQLGAGRDREFGEDVAEVAFDGARGQEQLRGDLLVRETLSNEASDVQFLWRELSGRAGVAPASRLAGGAQLASGTLGPGERTHLLERLDGRPEVRASVGSPPLTTKELPVEKLRACAVELPLAFGVKRECLFECGVRVGRFGKQRPAAHCECSGPPRSAVGCEAAVEGGEIGTRLVTSLARRVRFDQIGDGDGGEVGVAVVDHAGEPFRRFFDTTTAEIE